MKSYQFTCCVRIEAPGLPEDGELMPLYNMLTPIVKADGMAEALRNQSLIDFCSENKCTVYEVVRV